jgi:peptide deformylase
MPIRSIVRLGHPTLRSVAQALAPASIGEPAIQELIDDMIETMRAAHGVGLAAPQVGVSLQLFVYELAPPAAAESPGPDPAERPDRSDLPSDPPSGPPSDRSHRSDREAPGAIPLHVVVNPMLTPQAGELVYDWEGCLSIPDLRGLVPRHPAVHVRGLDRQGQPLDYVAQGFEARIVQHEYDHLNGVLFLDRMRDLKALAFREEWERYMAAGAAEPPDPLDPQAHASQPGQEAALDPSPAPPGDPAAI